MTTQLVLSNMITKLYSMPMHQTFGTKNEQKVFTLIQTLFQPHFISFYRNSLFLASTNSCFEAVLLNAMG
jgi:hypothetical protein